MIKIKFSHLYNKMKPGYEHSKLVEVLPVKLEDLSHDFRQYDTSYLDGGEEKQYALPENGDYMILLLLSGSGCLWTTIRRVTPEKIAYYRKHIGECVECVVND